MLNSLRQLFKSKYLKTRRGQRVPLEMLLNYRRTEQTDWRQGIAANISSGGVLFRADQAMDVHTPIHMSYSLPASIAGRAGLEVGCQAEVVRVEPIDSKDGTVFLAVKILHYDLAAR